MSSVKVKECNLDQYANLGDSYYSIAISTNENGYCEEIQIYDTNYIVIFDISDEMIYDIVQNNIDDFERFIGNIAKNVI
ncbi:hypothetical protein DV092_17090 [Clostridium botulinum]|uniref:hypothetical protein n=1 Tax=Clostridium sp. ZBS20 TaxID=2949966 RepID=UPI00207ADC13|nr:hypothetical protein [Clostridium sp. ZBS20]MBN1053734.1 hypothetical protein [Clostridium botulinum]